jgi:hypothetical protein
MKLFSFMYLEKLKKAVKKEKEWKLFLKNINRSDFNSLPVEKKVKFDERKCF